MFAKSHTLISAHNTQGSDDGSFAVYYYLWGFLNTASFWLISDGITNWNQTKTDIIDTPSSSIEALQVVMRYDPQNGQALCTFVCAQ